MNTLWIQSEDDEMVYIQLTPDENVEVADNCLKVYDRRKPLYTIPMCQIKKYGVVPSAPMPPL